MQNAQGVQRGKTVQDAKTRRVGRNPCSMQEARLLGAALPGHGVLDGPALGTVRSGLVRQVLSTSNRAVLPGRLDIWKARRPDVCVTFENRKQRQEQSLVHPALQGVMPWRAGRTGSPTVNNAKCKGRGRRASSSAGRTVWPKMRGVHYARNVRFSDQKWFLVKKIMGFLGFYCSRWYSRM